MIRTQSNAYSYILEQKHVYYVSYITRTILNYH